MSTSIIIMTNINEYSHENGVILSKTTIKYSKMKNIFY